MGVVRGGLERPDDLPRRHPHRDQRTGVEVVAGPRHPGVARGRVARARDVQVRLGVIRARHPHVAAAVARGIQRRPRLQRRVLRCHRHHVPLPLKLSGGRIEGLQEPRRIAVVARAHQHVVADHHRRHGREILVGQFRDLHVPALVPRAGIQRDQVVIRGLEEQRVVPQRGSSACDMCAAPGLPEVVPQLRPGAGIERPGIVRGRHVQHPGNLQHRAFHRGSRDGEVPLALAPDDSDRTARWQERIPRAAVPDLAVHPSRPGKGEVTHIALVDQLQVAVALPRVVPGVGGPRVRERLQQLRRGQQPGWSTGGFSGEDPPRHDRPGHQRRYGERIRSAHFKVAR